MIKNKFVLISGAGGYLGSNLCYLFSKKNFNLVCLDINKSRINVLKKKLNNFNNKKYFFVADISNERKVIDICKKLRNEKCKIDIIINNAANNPPVKKEKNTKLMTIKNWKDDLDVGLMGAYILTKTFVESMKQRKNGSIINIGSDLSILSPNHEIYKNKKNTFLKPISYSVIKHGLVGLNKYFATLYAKDRIISNMISPGPIDNKIPIYLKKKINCQYANEKTLLC